MVFEYTFLQRVINLATQRVNTCVGVCLSVERARARVRHDGVVSKVDIHLKYKDCFFSKWWHWKVIGQGDFCLMRNIWVKMH